MGDRTDDAFFEAVKPFRDGLRLHCYRMLGSSHDGDDVTQEVLVRAWRARDSLEDPALMRPWLYRIATNACLDELKRRPKRALASDSHAPAEDPRGPVAAAIDEPVWLEPMPDAWLGGDPGPAPDARYALRESVALAFVGALQALSPPQRATLLLRDVVGLSADETAAALGLSVSAANSALFRARTAVEEKLGGRDPSTLAASEVDEALLARYIKAWEGADVDAIVALLRDDIETTMPPSPTWLRGRAANEAFYRRMFASISHLGPARLVRTGANGQPAIAYYRAPAPGEAHRMRAIQVLDLAGGAIRRVDHFMLPEILPIFGLPATLPA